MKKYTIIGGQYQQRIYGETDSLPAAKRIATRNEEYWDNWQGWHKPEVFESIDCTSDGYRFPGAIPVASWNYRTNRWVDLKHLG